MAKIIPHIPLSRPQLEDIRVFLTLQRHRCVPFIIPSLSQSFDRQILINPFCRPFSVGFGAPVALDWITACHKCRHVSLEVIRETLLGSILNILAITACLVPSEYMALIVLTLSSVISDRTNPVFVLVTVLLRATLSATFCR